MKKTLHKDHVFAIILGVIAIVLLWLLNRKGLLHESVTARQIGNTTVSDAGTILPDPATGYPVFDRNAPSTIPQGEAFAVAPIDANGRITQFPGNPLTCTCPIGYSKWKDAADNSFWCLPDPGTVVENMGPTQGGAIA